MTPSAAEFMGKGSITSTLFHAKEASSPMDAGSGTAKACSTYKLLRMALQTDASSTTSVHS